MSGTGEWVSGRVGGRVDEWMSGCVGGSPADVTWHAPHYSICKCVRTRDSGVAQVEMWENIKSGIPKRKGRRVEGKKGKGNHQDHLQSLSPEGVGRRHFPNKGTTATRFEGRRSEVASGQWQVPSHGDHNPQIPPLYGLRQGVS